MTRTITITGGKGGVGKTSISLNIALCLSKLKSKVCLFDADLGLANINILLGLYPEYDLEDVILDKKSIKDILIKTPQGIDIIPGSSGVEKLANLEAEEIDHLVKSFSELEEYDYFLFDTSAGITKNVISFCLASSEVVIVITPEPTSLTDAYALLKVLCLNNFKGQVKIIVNQCKNTRVASQTYSKFKEVVQKYLTVDLLPLGVVVQDPKVPESVHKQQPLVTLFPESNAAKCIKIMASRLISNQTEDFDKMDIGSFWSRFMGFTKSTLEMSNGNKKNNSGKKAVDINPEPVSKNETKTIKEKSSDNDKQKNVKVTPHTVKEKKSVINNTTTEIKGKKFAPLQRENKRTSSSKFDRLEFAKNLPSLPHVLLKLMETCSKEDASIDDLAKIIRNDPSLSSKILNLVNSSYYGLPQKIHDFKQAISLLGMDAIKNLALSASVYQVFDEMEKDPSFNLQRYWFHSLECAVLANTIAKKIAYPFCEEAFVSGLLHDVGKLVLWNNFPNEYTEVLAEVEQEANLLEAEERILGVNHAEAGAFLIDHWQLESFIADAFLYHHEPVERIPNALPMVKIVYVANCLSSDAFDDDERLKIASDIMGLSSDEIDELMEQADSKVRQVALSLSIAIEDVKDKEAVLLSNKKAQDDLAIKVRERSLLQGTLQNLLNAKDINSILNVARHGLQILFDIKRILFFLYDKSENLLVGIDADSSSLDSAIKELSIPVQKNKGILVESLGLMMPANSFSKTSKDGLTIIDEQIIRLLNRDGIVCFPMAAKKNYVGVMVIGVDEAQLPSVEENSNLLSMFANYSALAIHAENIHQAQSKLIISERLAASTAIAKKVAHEVNNPLSIIKNYLKILEMRLDDQNIPSDEIKIVNEEITRVSLIIEELSDFSKPQTQKLEPFDINILLEDISKISREALLQKKINLHLNLASDLPRAITSKNSMKQVFINLIKNAAEAIQQDGNIFIETRLDDPEPDGSMDKKDRISITLRDDGPGLPNSVESRLFEPFVSTKGDEHAGLGLSIVYKILKEIKGTISCKTKEGEGTTFLITLPFESES